MNFIFPKFQGMATLAVLVYFWMFADMVSAAPVSNNQKKNIILMVSDGMGISGVQLARTFRQVRDDLPYTDLLEMDKHLIGTIRTRSESSYITDSAAAGTAFSTGKKSYNKAISVNTDKMPIASIMEALKLQGYKTGLVATTRMTDATPAVFSTHVKSRSDEDRIAQQMLGDHPLGRVPDLILGGGRCHFITNSTEGGCRTDDRNLIEEVKNNGTWRYAGTRAEFDALSTDLTLPILGLFAEGDIPFKIDRDEDVYPSLVEQAQFALTALSNATEDSDQGFFLMIESSRIDHSGHQNDPNAMVREILEYDQTMQEVLKFVEESDTETIVVGVSDHETGGLATLGEKPSDYQAILNATHSGEYLEKQIKDFEGKDDDNKLTTFISEEIIGTGLGITPTEDEISRVKKQVLAGKDGKVFLALNNLTTSRSKLRWTSEGHSAVDIGVYSFSNSDYLTYKVLNKRDGLAGAHENIDFANFVQSITNIDMEKTTEKIKDIQV